MQMSSSSTLLPLNNNSETDLLAIHLILKAVEIIYLIGYVIDHLHLE